MKTSKIIAAAALSLLAAVGAQAETYQGVQATVSANNRADIRAQSVIAAHSDDPEYKKLRKDLPKEWPI